MNENDDKIKPSKPPIKKKKTIIAVDFDGVICQDGSYPRIGYAKRNVIDILKDLKKNHNCILILWTCRSGKELQQAIDFAGSYGLIFDKVNENYVNFTKSPKIYADIYLDDKALNIKDVNRLYKKV